MARISFPRILIFWILLLGTLKDVISKVVLLNYLCHLIYMFLHTCGLWMESFIPFLPFPPLDPEASLKGFEYPSFFGFACSFILYLYLDL
jgi:hypothetical protein